MHPYLPGAFSCLRSSVGLLSEAAPTWLCRKNSCQDLAASSTTFFFSAFTCNHMDHLHHILIVRLQRQTWFCQTPTNLHAASSRYASKASPIRWYAQCPQPFLRDRPRFFVSISYQWLQLLPTSIRELTMLAMHAVRYPEPDPTSSTSQFAWISSVICRSAD